MKAIELVIFDCDGVIADSEAISADVLLMQLAATGLTMTPSDFRNKFLGRSFTTVAQTIREDYAHALPAQFELGYRKCLLDRFEHELHPTPGFKEMLGDLSLPSCVATSSSRARVTRTLQLIGLDENFGANVFTSSQVARGKPDPDLFLFAAQSMGVDPARCLVIEDSLPGITAAKRANMHVLGYRGGQHLKHAPALYPSDIRSFDNWTDFQQHLTHIESMGTRP